MGERQVFRRQTRIRIRERCETETENEARKEVCATKIDEMDDVEHEKFEAWRKHDDEEEFGQR